MRKKITALLLALLSFTLTLVYPNLITVKVLATEINPKYNLSIVAQNSHALQLEQKGKQYYDEGNFAKAAEIWQQASQAYGKDKEGKNLNLINQAKALQSLGYYEESCTSLLSIFTIANLSCKKFLEKTSDISKINREEENLDVNQKIQTNIKASPYFHTIKSQAYKNKSLNNLIALRLLGETLQKSGNLNHSEVFLELSEGLSKEYPENKNEKIAILLSRGNLKRQQGNKKRDEIDYLEIHRSIRDEFNIIVYENQKDKRETICTAENVENICKFYDLYYQAFTYYDEAKKLVATDKDYHQDENQDYRKTLDESNFLTQATQVNLNKLSLWVEIGEWWSQQNKVIERTINKKINNTLDISEKIDTYEKAAFANLDKLSPSREAIYAKINLADSLLTYRKYNHQLNNSDKQLRIKNLLSAAIYEADKLGDKQVKILALMNQARLYEIEYEETKDKFKEENKSPSEISLREAQKNIEEALSLSNKIDIDNRLLLYRQRHLLGRILKYQGKIEEAISSYGEAWNILQSLRGDLVSSADNQFAFRQNVEPVYREFIDLLLECNSNQQCHKNEVINKLVLLNQKSGNLLDNNENPQNQNLLYAARLVIESLQLAELDNFFQEPCSPPLTKPLEIDDSDKQSVYRTPNKTSNSLKNNKLNNSQDNKNNQNTAVIYPIILKNRIEVILSLGQNKSENYPYDIPENDAKKELETLSNIIYNDRRSDSAIRNIGDDEKYQENFKNNERIIQDISGKIYQWLMPEALVNKLTENHINSLVFVLDRAFQKIPIAVLYDGEKYLVQKYNIAINLGSQIQLNQDNKNKNIQILAAGVGERRTARGITFPGLKQVKQELKDLKKLAHKKNENNSTSFKVNIEQIDDFDAKSPPTFTKQGLRNKLNTLPDIVHISSHGIFSYNRDQTFILSGKKGEVIDIDDFQQLFKSQKKSIELLVLSACQTASGDERSALGIAGVALKSGARSTIASLWSVSADATADLMKEFYSNLIEKKMSRGESLAEAQRSLLQNEKYKHPFYWAPFILAGDWRQLKDS